MLTLRQHTYTPKEIKAFLDELRVLYVKLCAYKDAKSCISGVCGKCPYRHICYDISRLIKLLELEEKYDFPNAKR